MTSQQIPTSIVNAFESGVKRLGVFTASDGNKHAFWAPEDWLILCGRAADMLVQESLATQEAHKLTGEAA